MVSEKPFLKGPDLCIANLPYIVFAKQLIMNVVNSISQTVNHIVDMCPLIKFEGGHHLQSLHDEIDKQPRLD